MSDRYENVQGRLDQDQVNNDLTNRLHNVELELKKNSKLITKKINIKNTEWYENLLKFENEHGKQPWNPPAPMGEDADKIDQWFQDCSNKMKGKPTLGYAEVTLRDNEIPHYLISCSGGDSLNSNFEILRRNINKLPKDIRDRCFLVNKGEDSRLIFNNTRDIIDMSSHQSAAKDDDVSCQSCTECHIVLSAQENKVLSINKMKTFQRNEETGELSRNPPCTRCQADAATYDRYLSNQGISFTCGPDLSIESQKFLIEQREKDKHLLALQNDQIPNTAKNMLKNWSKFDQEINRINMVLKTVKDSTKRKPLLDARTFQKNEKIKYGQKLAEFQATNSSVLPEEVKREINKAIAESQPEQAPKQNSNISKKPSNKK